MNADGKRRHPNTELWVPHCSEVGDIRRMQQGLKRRKNRQAEAKFKKYVKEERLIN